MKIHHLGFVVSSITDSIQHYKALFQFVQLTDVIEDPIQRVKVVFLSDGKEGSTQIELIEPLNESSPVADFLKKGGGLNHIAYGVPDIHKAVEELTQNSNIRIICPPVVGAGHDNHLVSFLYANLDCPRGHVFELVEMPEL
jgi:methylmalonyl-CoA/ethylmalonyl-CoA epimerase